MLIDQKLDQNNELRKEDAYRTEHAGHGKDTHEADHASFEQAQRDRKVLAIALIIIVAIALVSCIA